MVARLNLANDLSLLRSASSRKDFLQCALFIAQIDHQRT
jgi:hypothetical protein